MSRLPLLRTALVPAAVIAVALTLSACGRRGDPELPSATPKAQSASPIPTSSDKAARRIDKPKDSFILDPLL